MLSGFGDDNGRIPENRFPSCEALGKCRPSPQPPTPRAMERLSMDYQAVPFFTVSHAKVVSQSLQSFPFHFSRFFSRWDPIRDNDKL